jgi:hypothetical protein
MPATDIVPFRKIQPLGCLVATAAAAASPDRITPSM